MWIRTLTLWLYRFENLVAFEEADEKVENTNVQTLQIQSISQYSCSLCWTFKFNNVPKLCVSLCKNLCVCIKNELVASLVPFGMRLFFVFTINTAVPDRVERIINFAFCITN